MMENGVRLRLHASCAARTAQARHGAHALLLALALSGCVKHPPITPPVDQAALAYKHAVTTCNGGAAGPDDAYAAAETSCTAVIKSPLATPADAGNALRNRAALYVLDENYASAATDYTELARATPDDQAVLLALAKADMKLGRCAAAAKRYDALVKLAPKHADILEARGDAFVCSKQDENAVRDFTAAMGPKPRAALYVKRATAYARLGDDDSALGDYNAALALQPRDTAALAGRAAIYLGQDNYSQALQDYDAASQTGALTAEAAYGRGAAELGQQNYAAAISDFDHALKLNGKLAKAFEARARAYMRQGDYDKALLDYSQLIAMKKAAADAYFHRGQIYGFKGDYDRAIADYGEAIQIDPTLVAAIVNRGDCYMARGQYEPAIADFSHAQQANTADKRVAERLRKAKTELAKQQAVKGISIEATYPKQ